MTQAKQLSDLSQAYTAGPLVFRNKLINGNFDFWQRGTSLSGPGYLADRWGIDAAGAPALTQSRQPFALGASALGAPAKYYANINITSSGDAAAGVVLFRQRIEGVDALRGQVMVSFWASADAGKSIGVNVAQVFGTGGSPSATVYAGAQKITPGTSFVKQSLIFTLPSTAGKTLGTNGDDFIEVEFYLTAGTNYSSSVSGGVGAQTGNFNLAQVQIEAGAVATPFEMRPPQVELALCQRYYQFWSSVMIGGAGGVNGNGYFGEVYLPTAMRVSPTVAYSNVTYLNGSGIATNSANSQHVRVSFTTSATQTAYAITDMTMSAEL